MIKNYEGNEKAKLGNKEILGKGEKGHHRKAVWPEFIHQNSYALKNDWGARKWRQ